MKIRFVGENAGFGDVDESELASMLYAGARHTQLTENIYLTQPKKKGSGCVQEV